MTFDEAYSLALEHGEETIVSFKKRVREDKEWRSLYKKTSYDLKNNYKSMNMNELQRAASLYHLTTAEVSLRFLKPLLRSNKEGIRKIGLQLAG